MIESHEKLAHELVNARQNGATIPLPAKIPENRSEAYAIQDRMAEAISMPVNGWKFGAAVEAVHFFEFSQVRHN